MSGVQIGRIHRAQFFPRQGEGEGGRKGERKELGREKEESQRERQWERDKGRYNE